MPSFFEKLKKGMGIEIPAEEKLKKKPPKESKLPPKETSPRLKKLEIKDEEKLPQAEITPEPEAKEKEEIEVKKEKWLEPEGQLVVDIYQNERDLVIQSPIAGVKPEDLDISIENDRILIKGERNLPVEEGERSYFYQECYWGPFSKQIILPVETDPNRAEATMKEGILTIRIPKIERKKKRKIVVKG